MISIAVRLEFLGASFLKAGFSGGKLYMDDSFRIYSLRDVEVIVVQVKRKECSLLVVIQIVGLYLESSNGVHRLSHY